MNTKQEDNKLSNKEKIDIMMKEYETLRAEIIHRCNTRFAFVGLLGALATYAFFKNNTINMLTLVFLIVAALFLLFVWLYIGHIIVRCSRRIAEIEKQVNTLADEQLLVWENRQKINIIHKFDEMVREKKDGVN